MFEAIGSSRMYDPRITAPPYQLGYAVGISMLLERDAVISHRSYGRKLRFLELWFDDKAGPQSGGCGSASP